MMMIDRIVASTHLAIATALVVMLGLFTSASATTVEKKSFNDLVREAQMIAVGRVASVESHPTSDNRFAYAYVTVGQIEVLKGTYRHSAITLRMAGGPLGNGRVLSVDGMPSFKPGEKVVLFVKGNGRLLCPLVGWWQGLLRVDWDSRRGQEVIKTSAGLGIRTIERGDFVVRAKVSPQEAGDSAGTPDEGPAVDAPPAKAADTEADMTLDHLRSRVRNALARLGASIQTTEEVESAGIELNSPGPRSGKPPRKEN